MAKMVEEWAESGCMYRRARGAPPRTARGGGGGGGGGGGVDPAPANRASRRGAERGGAGERCCVCAE
eukprot:COSAG03_NODE_2380_length_2824_cov_24.791927_1_plen_66_part_10